MEPNPSRKIIGSYEKQFTYYKGLGEKAMAQLKEGELFEAPSEEENSIAVIVKHLNGNMLSRWTDFLTSDGEKEWRERDNEFVLDPSQGGDVNALWDSGWSCLLDSLSELDDGMTEKKIYIRNQSHTVLEAINRQIAHYAYHVGQIVLLAKQFRGNSWQSLSIPRNASKQFNEEKFSKQKTDQHYTDEWNKKGQ